MAVPRKDNRLIVPPLFWALPYPGATFRGPKAIVGLGHLIHRVGAPSLSGRPRFDEPPKGKSVDEVSGTEKRAGADREDR